MPKPAFEPIQTSRDLSARVCAQLEQAILVGAFGVDDRLPTEAELGQSFQVSRTAIREALQQLKARGLVRSIPGSGNYVCPFPFHELEKTLGFFGSLGGDPQLFQHYLELRVALEGECARRVALEVPAGLLKRLRACIAAMQREAYSRGDLSKRFVAQDVAFHLELAKANPNPFYRALLGCLKSLHTRYALASYDSPEWMQKNIRDHERILAAIETGDGAQAEERMRAHLRESIAHYVACVQQDKHAPDSSSIPVPSKQNRKRSRHQ